MATEADRRAERAVHTPKIKLQPPRRPEAYVWRPRLERLIDSATERRLTIVVAGPGYGKSTLVASRAVEHGWVWYSADSGDASIHTFARGLRDAVAAQVPTLSEAIPDEAFGADVEGLAAAFSQALETTLERDVVLVVDDAHELGQDSASTRFVEAIFRQSPLELHLVLATREEPPFRTGRMQGQGQALRIDSSALAFTAEEIEVLLLDIGPDLASAAGDLHEATGGWPAAVQLGAQVLATASAEDRAQPLLALRRGRGPLFDYLAEEVLRREPADVIELLRVVAALERFAPELCGELDLPEPEERLAHLQRRGFVITGRGTTELLSLHPLLRDFVRETWPLDEDERRATHRLAARWAESGGMLREALESWLEAGEPDEVARVLHERGKELFDAGLVGVVVEAAARIPHDLLDSDAKALVASSAGILGEGETELRILDELAAEDPASLSFVSFQLGNRYMLRGRPRDAIDSFLSTDERHPMHLAFAAYAYFELGELDDSRRYALQALEASRATGHLTAEAEANMGLASILIEEGDLSTAETHCEAALDAALRAHNVLAECSARTRFAELRIAQGRYHDALAATEETLLLAGRIGFALFNAWGLLVRGRVHHHLGRLDEAIADFTLSVDRYGRLGGAAPRSWGYQHLGEVHLGRGDLVQARSAFETALALGEEVDSRFLRAMALSRLARVLVGESPERAVQLAAEGVELGGGVRLHSLLGRGWVRLAVEDRAGAAADAAAALSEARGRGDRTGLAEALELRGAVEPEGRESLEEALAIWRELESPIPVARIALALAVRSGATLDVMRARKKLRQLGVREGAFRAAGPLFQIEEKEAAPLVIQTLGGFKVLRGGEEVPAAEWKSKKARDLLKLLVSARGRPLTREQLIEALWPGEPLERTSNRLSVALSTARAALDPDRSCDHGHFIAAEEGIVRLRLDHIIVDVEAFLADAGAALRAWRKAQGEDARLQLEEAEQSYGGDFLAEDLYEPWTSTLREEARGTYGDLLGALADASEGREAARYCLRILEADPLDERAHITLVAALLEGGAHGEARRAYAGYVGQMARIGIEPVPLAGLTRRAV
jgi:DNA-binding SARP family transcriptional activator/tetratricopeptide (TPR) repeat protein